MRLTIKKNVHNSLRGKKKKNAASVFEAKPHLIYFFLRICYLNIDRQFELMGVRPFLIAKMLKLL